ncbi:MAG: hypothetical protein KTR31_04085 [Myxococcales bacterium]|nr:hypothetical protein [Myxococcales bacterium]
MSWIGWLWCLSSALAAESAAESTWDRWASMNDLQVEADLVRPLPEPVEVRNGPGVIRLEGGYLVPVFSGRLRGSWERGAREYLREQRRMGLDPRLPTEEERGSRELVGWVWTGGTGTLTTHLKDRADALLLANHLVRVTGADKAELADLAYGRAPLQVAVEDVVYVSTQPQVDEIFAGPQNIDPYEVVVIGTSKEAERAARRAEGVFASRLETWNATGIGAGGRIGWDRIAIERGALPEVGTFTIVDALTDQRFGRVAPQTGGEVDRWLAVIRDTTGAVDWRRRYRVASLGISPRGPGINGLVGGVPHPPSVVGDPTSARLPPVRVEGTTARSRVLVAPTRNGLQLSVDVESHLTVRAVGGPATQITMALPKMDRVPGSFEVVAAELMDGTPLLGRPPQPERAPDDDDDDDDDRRDPDDEPEAEELPQPTDALVQLLLPEPLPAGESIQIRLAHRDTWPYANHVDSYLGVTSGGRSSGMQGFLPRLHPAAPGGPWAWTVEVGVPANSKLTAAVGGKTLEERQENGWRLVRASTGNRTQRWPTVAAGRFHTVKNPAHGDYPAVRVHLLSQHYGAIDQFGPEVRRVVQYFQRWLPPFPVDEMDVFEAPRQHGGFVWVAPHGMVNVQQMMVMGTARAAGGRNLHNRVPKLSSSVFAHELAHQYWGHLAPPASTEDFWISETFSELFSCMYVGAAFSPKACTQRMAQHRATWEHRVEPWGVDASLSRAYFYRDQPDVVYRYGPVLMSEGLQRKLGREAFFRALDVLLREHPQVPLTTERLQAYLEQSSGQDLSEWFDFFVHGGYVPKLSLTYAQQGGVLQGKVTSDVPFGAFDVLVRAVAKDEVAEQWVTVRDGEGSFELPSPGKRAQVVLDPHEQLVAASRSVRELKAKR